MSGHAMLDRLQIRNIRSFGPTPETIQFFTPLTLIVGLNGSGKTTIIECLKYSCTGDLPPNSKGGAFVHDPQLLGEKEVLAQVRLRCIDAKGRQLDATRSMQLTVKKQTRQFKTLEAQLFMKVDGERSSISSRVAELDKMLPQYLGVSKAIIENVVFCHQEESLWPMSEPSVLKKKFDEIFEAQKYTKAIDNIKVLRKKRNEELARCKIIEAHSKEDKIKSQKAEKQMMHLKTQIEDLRSVSETLERQVASASKESHDAYDKSSQFVAKVEELNAKRSSEASKQDLLQDLRAHLKPMEDSDAELEKMSEQYQDRVQQYDQDLEAQKAEYQSLQTQISTGRAREGEKRVDLGRLQAEKGSHERQLVQREELVKESARRHNIRGFDHDLSSKQIIGFLDRIAKMVKDQTSALERARRDTQTQLGDAQSELDHHKEDRLVIIQRRESAKQQITANEKRLSDQRRSADKLEVDEGRQAAIEASIEDIHGRLEAAKTAVRSSSWDKQISAIQTDISLLEQQAGDLQKELMQAVEQAGGASELNRLKRLLKETRLRLDTNKGAQSSRISALLGSDWDDTNLDESFQQVLSSRISDTRQAEQQRDGISRELEQVAVTLKSLRDNLSKYEKEKAQAGEKTTNAIGKDDPSEFAEQLEHLQRDRDDLAMEHTNFKARQDFWKSCQQTFEQKNACRVCARPFKTAEDSTRLRENLKKFVTDAQYKALAESLKEADAEIASVKAVRPSYDRWVRLVEVDLPELKTEMSKFESKHGQLQENLEKHDRKVADRLSDQQEAESFSKTIQAIVQDRQKIGTVEAELETLTKKHPTFSQMRAPDEINGESTRIQDQLRTLRNKMTKLQADRDKASENVNSLEIELRDTKSKLQTILGQLKEKSTIAATIAELSSASEDSRRTLKQCDQDIDSVSPKIAQSEARLVELRQRRDAKERELREDAAALTNTRDRLELAEKDIRLYLEKNGPEELSKSEQELEGLRKNLERLESDQRLLTNNINKMRTQQQKHDETKRHIVENLRFRRLVREVEDLQQDIATLESENVQADREYYYREGQKWALERDKLSAEKMGAIGEMKQLDSRLGDLLAEYETDGKNAAAKYKEANIKVEAIKAVVEDLGRYGGALDKAIMKFHTMKMEQINTLIEELWRRTYQGTDVDTILIRSDSEGAKGKGSYNYRVCMVKQDAEMDMRGRCSAGQKVLASIIIRLALAECFGANCGIIALDEPTTNLDRDNIRALAESLHSIIKYRQAQKNFQLIVITHDEEFLKEMHCSEHADMYFRVGRGPDQKSDITKQSIAEVINDVDYD